MGCSGVVLNTDSWVSDFSYTEGKRLTSPNQHRDTQNWRLNPSMTCVKSLVGLERYKESAGLCCERKGILFNFRIAILPNEPWNTTTKAEVRYFLLNEGWLLHSRKLNISYKKGHEMTERDVYWIEFRLIMIAWFVTHLLYVNTELNSRNRKPCGIFLISQ